MKKLFALLMMLPCLVFAEDKAEEVKLEGKITDVTVYISGKARVTRSQTVDLKKGLTTFRSSALPAQASTKSIQASVSAKGARIDSVETKRVLITEKDLKGKLAEYRKKILAQEDAVFEINQRMRALSDATRANQETINFLSNLRNHVSNVATKEMKTEKMDVVKWTEALELSKTQSAAARKEIRANESKTRLIRRELNAANLKMNELRSKYPRSTHQNFVFITIAADAATAAKLKIKYSVSSAAWEPAYRVSADVVKEHATLEVFGIISQRSGEDWKGVNLSLSTARPDIGTSAPILKPWYIRTHAVRAPYKYEGKVGEKSSGWRQNGFDGLSTGKEMPGMSNLPVVGGAFARGDATPIAPSYNSSSSFGVATVFKALGKGEIPSDGEDHKIPVALLNSKIKLRHIAIPKVMQFAFLEATMEKAASYPLLTGIVDVVVGESYVGRGMLNATAAGQPAKLSLGIDENVRISIKALQDRLVRTRRGGRIQTTNVFEISATNFAGKEVNLTVLDQIPVSGNVTQIKVVVSKVTKRALVGPKAPGQLKWELKMKPGQKEKIEFGFMIDYPEKMQRSLRAANKKNSPNYITNEIQDNGLRNSKSQRYQQKEKLNWNNDKTMQMKF